MDTNRHESPRRGLHEFLQILSCGIQSLLIPEILVCKVCDSWSFMPISMKVSTACAICSERPFSSSPRDAGVGRGLRRGATSQIVPPLPVPLLHPMEEREFFRLRLRRAESIRGFAPRTFNGNC